MRQSITEWRGDTHTKLAAVAPGIRFQKRGLDSNDEIASYGDCVTAKKTVRYNRVKKAGGLYWNSPAPVRGMVQEKVVQGKCQPAVAGLRCVQPLAPLECEAREEA